MMDLVPARSFAPFAQGRHLREPSRLTKIIVKKVKRATATHVSGAPDENREGQRDGAVTFPDCYGPARKTGRPG